MRHVLNGFVCSVGGLSGCACVVLCGVVSVVL